MNRLLTLALPLIVVSGAASAVDLQTVYDHALSADPVMRQAEALHLASRETRTQAILDMLPLDTNVSKTWNGRESNSVATPILGNLSLQVNLFSWAKWVALKQANSVVAQGEANYQAARQDLILRVAQQYFAVLAAKDTLAAQASALQSVNRQLEQAERRFEVGLIAVTDVQIARAARDSTAAAVIAAKRVVANAEEQLRATTSEKYNQLAEPSATMPLLTPDPASEDAWVSTALSQNATLIASRMSADINHAQYLAAIGGHLPTVTASATRSWNLEDTNSPGTLVRLPGNDPTNSTLGFINTQDVIWSVAVTVPIFSAGATQSRVRQARYLWNAGQAGYDFTLRQTEQQARDAYQGVISQIAQVGALKQAVQSNQVSLQATEAGYEVGTKTAIDVLSSRELLVQAQTNYSQAKYGYLNNIIALRLAAGNLDPSSIRQINGWLVEPPPPPPEGQSTAMPATNPAPTSTVPPDTSTAPASDTVPASGNAPATTITTVPADVMLPAPTTPPANSPQTGPSPQPAAPAPRPETGPRVIPTPTPSTAPPPPPSPR
ncbi:MAG TPA: TolC family outer membrane protein [Steroidobacteraceae bacterium]|nr:TolC family outer membrane protein [Steroidobacteraceae bacterium]